MSHASRTRRVCLPVLTPSAHPLLGPWALGLWLALGPRLGHGAPDGAPPQAPTRAPLAAAAPAVTPDALVAAALRHHPALAAARAGVRAARAHVGGADAWPWPRLQIAAAPLPIETRNGPAWASVGVAWPLPWPSERAAQRGLAEGRAAEARAATDLARLAVARAVRQAAVDLWAIEALARLNARHLALADRLIELAQARLAAGANVQSDLLEAQVARARLADDGIDLAQHTGLRRAAVNSLIGQPLSAPLGPIAAPAVRPTEAAEALMARARAVHPALARAAAAQRTARSQRAVADRAGWPQLTPGLNYTFIGTADPPAMNSDPGRQALQLTLGLTLPLWQTAPDAAAEAARAAEAAAEAAHDEAERQQLLAVLTQHVTATSAARRVALYTDRVLPLAREVAELREARYSAGESRFSGLLDAQRALIGHEQAQIQAQAEFGRALADLQWAVGEPVADTPPTDSGHAAPRQDAP